MSLLIGRDLQIRKMRHRYYSGMSEFVVVYGRLGVGKTVPVEESIKNGITFNHRPLSPIQLRQRIDSMECQDEKKLSKIMLREQLKHFFYTLKLHGFQGNVVPKSWGEAFLFLSQLLKELDVGRR